MNKIYLAIIVFLLLGALMIKCSLDTDFSQEDDRSNFLKAMSSWLKKVGSNTKDTAEYAVKEKDWLPSDEDLKQSENKEQSESEEEQPSEELNKTNSEQQEK